MCVECGTLYLHRDSSLLVQCESRRTKDVKWHLPAVVNEKIPVLLKVLESILKKEVTQSGSAKTDGGGLLSGDLRLWGLLLRGPSFRFNKWENIFLFLWGSVMRKPKQSIAHYLVLVPFWSDHQSGITRWEPYLPWLSLNTSSPRTQRTYLSSKRTHNHLAVVLLRHRDLAIAFVLVLIALSLCCLLLCF